MPDADFDGLWQRLVAKRPLLADAAAKVEISVDNFKALLQQFFEQGKQGDQDPLGRS